MTRLSALLRSTHPGPSLAVTVITVLLGVASGLEPWRVVVLGGAMLFDQFSVGLSNDWIDADRDRMVGRADKPVASGVVSASLARAAALAAAVIALAATIPLGFAALGVHAFVLAVAWLYNASLKSTPLSFLPYTICFGLLPALVTFSRPEPAFPAWWALLAGALLGTGAHFANVLPDLEDDRATGVRGLGHRIGLRASTVVTWLALVAASVAIAVGVGFTIFAIVALAVAAVITVVGLVLALTRPPSRWLFRLVILGALIDVVMLVSAGSRFVQ